MNAAPGYKWNVNELASNINVSTRQFQRLMQTNYGFTAEKMLRKIRMDHAGELLKGTQLTVEDISDKVGYESVNIYNWRIFIYEKNTFINTYFFRIQCDLRS